MNPAYEDTQKYLAQTGGRRGCAHPVHRFAQIPDPTKARLILPECAGREAWLAARQGGVGGSEVGALIGASHYETALSVWHTKMNGGKDLSGVAAVEWGHRLEDVVAEKTAEEIGLTSRFAGGLWASTESDIFRVTPDRFATKWRSWKAVGVIECKTAGDDAEWESGTITPSGGTGSAPLAYQAQTQWQLGILGLPRGWLGCLVLGSERNFFVVELEFDPAWFAEMKAEALRFWRENVQADEMPIADLRHPRTEDLLKEVHPHVVRESVQLDPDAEDWLDDYRIARERFNTAERDLKEIQNYFRMHVGDAAAGYLGENKVVSYPEVTTSRIDVEALKARYPEVAEEVTVKSVHRRMTIRAPKK